MPEDETEAKFESEEKRRLQWRREQLEKHGFSGLCLESMLMAGVDHHAVEKLLKSGASKNEVVRILL